jgi:hypothetical protein
MHLNPTQVHQNIHVELVMNLSLGSMMQRIQPDIMLIKV